MIICLSASHKNTSLQMLETLAIKNDAELMKAICLENLVQECVLLETCHRVEIYCVVKDATKDEALRRIVKAWSAECGVSLDLLAKIVETYQGKEALTHLFFLASGLESVVVGEDQILGQVRTAYVKAKKHGMTGLVFDRAFMKAINLGRQIRTDTRINEGSTSISSAAVDLATKELGSLKEIRTLVIGAGEAATVAVETLSRKGAEDISVANRTFERGQQLASKVSGRAVQYSHLYDALSKTDLAISAVTVRKPVLTKRRLRSALRKKGRSRSLMIIDISQPRSVEESIAELGGVSLRNIDDLKQVVEESMLSRQSEAEKAKKMILKELEAFERQLSGLFAEPLISEIYRRLEEVRCRELERAKSKMGEIDRKKLAIIDRFSRELVERVMQVPIKQLREATLNENDNLLAAVERLFQVKR